MKKIITFLLLFIASISLCSCKKDHHGDNGEITDNNQIDMNKVTDFYGSKYRITSIVEENELYGGIKHTKYSAESSYSKDVSGSYVGQTYKDQFYPQSVNVLEIPNNKDVKVVQWSFHSDTSAEWSLTTVTAMAENYENLHPGYKVLATINGDFFDINSTASYGPLIKSTRGVGVSDGEVIRPIDARGLNNSPLTIGFKNDGSSTNYVQGGQIAFSDNHILALYDEKGNIIEEIEIKSINSEPAEGEVAVYFSYPTGVGEVSKSQGYQLVTMPANNAYFCESPMRIVPNSANDLYAKGKLDVVRETKELVWGSFGIVTSNQDIRRKIEASAYVRVQKNVIGDYADCTSIGGAVFAMLQDSEEITANEDIRNYRHPRTMIGAKADGSIVMATVDGRQKSKNMYGMTGDEQGALMKYYGCVSAVNLDGGGSTTIAIRDENNKFRVLNSPSDGNLRKDSNCYLVVMKEADFSIAEANITDSSISFTLDTSEVDFNQTKAIKCTLNGVTKKVVNGKVTFKNLTNNTTYKYVFSYDTKDKKDIPTLLEGEINSAKKQPTFGELKIETGTNKLIFTPEINDPDLALEYYRILINDKRNPYLDEPIEVKYDLTNVTQIEFDILTCYNLNDGKGKIEVNEHKVYDLTTGKFIEEKKTGCKKELNTLIVGIISLGVMVTLIKKRER